MGTLSSNSFSTDTQAADALAWLRSEHPDAAQIVDAQFPEPRVWDGSWLDTAAMGVDVEYGSWLIDAIEATGLIVWWEGEPFTADSFDDETDDDDEIDR